MKRIVVECEAGERFEFELTDEKWDLWQRIAAAKGQTIDESFAEILRDFMASHPIIAQTRSVQ